MPDLSAIRMCHDVGFVKVTLAERHQFHTIVQVYKILHHLVPTYLQDTFMFAKDFTRFAGRNRYRLFIPRMKTTHIWTKETVLQGW